MRRGPRLWPHSRSFREILTGAEVALSLVLLMLAGLLFTALSASTRPTRCTRGQRADNGDDAGRPKYRDAATRSVAIGALGDRLRRSLASTSPAWCLPPVSGFCDVLFFDIEGKP